ncbi:MAG: MarR family transcriptional regulator [Acidobacteria bacterium]|nr:MarR family transcriptional regulator [Acidobacteriota bacterium]MBW4044234.1 MarR family transcriptional regulator [Acidobacteriota bacterium]
MKQEDSSMDEVLRDLASFRYTLRKFLRFSEKAARQCGVTPQQHQLMLGVAGHTGRGSATISELAEFLQERHNSVAGLVERAVQNGLVHREQSDLDRRFVDVSLTSRGAKILAKLAKLHEQEVGRVRAGFLEAAHPEKKQSAAAKRLAKRKQNA